MSSSIKLHEHFIADTVHHRRLALVICVEPCHHNFLKRSRLLSRSLFIRQESVMIDSNSDGGLYVIFYEKSKDV